MAHVFLVAAAFVLAFASGDLGPPAGYEPLLPGVDKVLSTIDLRYLDVVKPPTQLAYLRNAFDVTYSQNKTVRVCENRALTLGERAGRAARRVPTLCCSLAPQVRGIDGLVYSIPDQINAVVVSQGSCETSAVYVASALNISAAYSSSFSKSTSDSDFFGLIQVTSSLSASTQDALSIQTANYAAVGATFCNVTTMEATVDPVSTLTVSDIFNSSVHQYLLPNPSYLSNVANWNAFFSLFGFALPVSAIFGGSAGATWGTYMSAFVGQGSLWASAQAAAELSVFVDSAGGSASGGGGASGASDAFLSASFNTSFWNGGSCVPGGAAGCSFNEWLV